MICMSGFTVKIKKLGAALSALAILSLSACAPEAQPSATGSAAGTASATVKVTAQRGGELSLAMPSSPASVHPLYLNETSMLNLYWLVFEPLSCLADSWEYDEAQGVYIIKIRSGVQWHGERGEVTANDVVFTLQQILNSTESIYNKQIAKYIQSVSVSDLQLLLLPV